MAQQLLDKSLRKMAVDAYRLVPRPGTVSSRSVIRHKESQPLRFVHGLIITRLNSEADASYQAVYAAMKNHFALNQWMLIEHDPNVPVDGPNCNVNGKHYHVIWASDTYWDNCHRTKTFKGVLTANALKVKMQTIRHPEAYATYMRLPGRVLVGTNLPEDTSFIHPIFSYYSDATDDSITTMNNKKCKERGSIMDNTTDIPDGKKFDTDFLQALVTKYSGISVNLLVDKVFRYENDDVKARFERIYYKSTFMNLYSKVKCRVTISQLDKTLGELSDDWLALYSVMDEAEQAQFMSVRESDDILRDWLYFPEH